MVSGSAEMGLEPESTGMELDFQFEFTGAWLEATSSGVVLEPQSIGIFLALGSTV